MAKFTLPQPPAWLDNNWTKPLFMDIERTVMNVKRLLVLPCSVPVEVMVETGVEAAIEAIWSVVDPDPKEVYHKIAGRSFVCEAKGVISEAQRMTNIEPGLGTRFLFKSAELFDFTVWYLFLTSVTTQAAMDWSSFALKQTQCTDKNNPNYGNGVLWAGSLYNDSVWRDVDFAFPPGSNYYPVAPSGTAVRPGGHAIVACSVKFKAGDVVVGTSGRLMSSFSPAPLDTHTNAVASGEGKGLNQVWWKGQNPADETMTLNAEFSYGGPFPQVFADSETASCTIYNSRPV